MLSLGYSFLSSVELHFGNRNRCAVYGKTLMASQQAHSTIAPPSQWTSFQNEFLMCISPVLPSESNHSVLALIGSVLPQIYKTIKGNWSFMQAGEDQLQRSRSSLHLCWGVESGPPRKYLPPAWLISEYLSHYLVLKWTWNKISNAQWQ